jgi:hypothetical protein
MRPFPRRRCASRTAIGEEIDQQLRWCCAAVAVVRVGPTASTLSGGSAPRPRGERKQTKRPDHFTAETNNI